MPWNKTLRMCTHVWCHDSSLFQRTFSNLKDKSESASAACFISGSATSRTLREIRYRQPAQRRCSSCCVQLHPLYPVCVAIRLTLLLIYLFFVSKLNISRRRHEEVQKVMNSIQTSTLKLLIFNLHDFIFI